MSFIVSLNCSWIGWNLWHKSHIRSCSFTNRIISLFSKIQTMIIWRAGSVSDQQKVESNSVQIACIQHTLGSCLIHVVSILLLSTFVWSLTLLALHILLCCYVALHYYNDSEEERSWSRFIIVSRKFTWKILLLNARLAVKFFPGDQELIFLLHAIHDRLDQLFVSLLDCKFVHSVG